ncbi:hypothetical protein OT424_000512 [Listeria monocytogenes serotype 1/2a]|nr:hypothetical protein [Listeria monocytogenes serotype 1/2a]
MMNIVHDVSSATENALTAKMKRSYVKPVGMYIRMKSGTERMIKMLRNIWLF